MISTPPKNSKEHKTRLLSGKIWIILFKIISACLMIGTISLIILLFIIPSWFLIYSFELLMFFGQFLSSALFIIGLVIVLPISLVNCYGIIKKIRIHKRKFTLMISKAKKTLILINFVLLIVLFSFLPAFFGDYEQYKKYHRDQITLIAKGNPEIALIFSQHYAWWNPEDPETYFVQAAAYSVMEQEENAYSALEKAIELGLPFERFLAGPRTLFENLYDYDKFKDLKSEKEISLVHGPMVANVTFNSASIWVRMASETDIYVRYANNSQFTSSLTSSNYTTLKSDDYTAVIQLNNLNSSTKYYYELYSNGKKIEIERDLFFSTYPEKTAIAKIEIGFGGGAGYAPDHEKMWNTIKAQKTDAFLLMGDNVYIDTPDVPETQKYCYYRRQSREEYQDFCGMTPIYAIWDDHDFGTNDCTSSLEVDDPSWKLDVLDIFKQNFVNPYYGGGSEVPGIWFNFSIGDVDIFMLDCRFYRQNPSEIFNPSMLGPAQREWLLDGLKNSDATFKIIASSVPWAYGAKPGSKDTWEGFQEEREEIFSYIEDEKIEGVVLLSADRHRSDVWKIERDNGYDFYEFESSKLTNYHTHEVLEGSIYGYNEKCSFGLLKIDTGKTDPELTYEIININGDSMYNLEITKSELEFS